jgi:hypothetical protein
MAGMDGAGFDAPVKGLAAGSTRRRVLGRLGAAVGAAALGRMVTGADADAESCLAEAARTARGCRATCVESGGGTAPACLMRCEAASMEALGVCAAE